MEYRKHVRLKPEFYIRGWYFLTLVARHREKLLESPYAQRILSEEMEKLKDRYSGWNIDETIFMPDHLHTIWWTDGGISLAKVVGAYKSLVAKRFREEIGEKRSPWQPNYYEHIIRSEKELQKVRLYIRANPYEERIDWSRFDDYI